MDDDVEALVRGRKDEITREQVESGFANLIWVLATFVARSQPLFAESVGSIQDMKLMGDVGLIYHRTHPAAPAHSVCWEIEDN
jgi:hypothetical protein